MPPRRHSSSSLRSSSIPHDVNRVSFMLLWSFFPDDDVLEGRPRRSFPRRSRAGLGLSAGIVPSRVWFYRVGWIDPFTSNNDVAACPGADSTARARWRLTSAVPVLVEPASSHATSRARGSSVQRAQQTVVEITASAGLEPRVFFRPPDWSRAIGDRPAGSAATHVRGPRQAVQRVVKGAVLEKKNASAALHPTG